MTALKRSFIPVTLAAAIFMSGCGPTDNSESGLKSDSASILAARSNVVQSGTVLNSVAACQKAVAEAAKKNRLKSIFQGLATSIFGFIPIPGAAIIGKVVNTGVATTVNVVLPTSYSAGCDVNDIRIQALGQEVANIYNELKTEISALKGSVGDTVSYYLAADLAAQNRYLMNLTYNPSYEFALSSPNAGREVEKKAAAGGNGKGGNSADQELIPIDGDKDWVRAFKYNSKNDIDDYFTAADATLSKMKAGYSLMDGATKPGSRNFFDVLKYLGTIVFPAFGALDLNAQLYILAYDLSAEGNYTDEQVFLPKMKTLYEDSTKELYTTISLVRDLVKLNPGVEIRFNNVPTMQWKKPTDHNGRVYEWNDVVASYGGLNAYSWKAGQSFRVRINPKDKGLDFKLTVFGKEGGATITQGTLNLAGQEFDMTFPKGGTPAPYGNISYDKAFFDSEDFKKTIHDLLEKKVINGDFPDPTAQTLKSDFLKTRDMYDTLDICQLEKMQRELEKICSVNKLDLNKCKGISESVKPEVTPTSKTCGGDGRTNAPPGNEKQY